MSQVFAFKIKISSVLALAMLISACNGGGGGGGAPAPRAVPSHAPVTVPPPASSATLNRGQKISGGSISAYVAIGNRGIRSANQASTQITAIQPSEKLGK